MIQDTPRAHNASIAILVLLVLSGAVPTAQATPISVTLKVHAGSTAPFDVPAILIECTVTFSGNNLTSLLNQAVADGCIDGWTSAVYDTIPTLSSITGPGQTPTMDSFEPMMWGCFYQQSPCPLQWSGWFTIVNEAQVCLQNHIFSPLDSCEFLNGSQVELFYLVDNCSSSNLLLLLENNGQHGDPPAPVPTQPSTQAVADPAGCKAGNANLPRTGKTTMAHPSIEFTRLATGWSSKNCEVTWTAKVTGASSTNHYTYELGQWQPTINTVGAMGAPGPVDKTHGPTKIGLTHGQTVRVFANIANDEDATDTASDSKKFTC